MFPPTTTKEEEEEGRMRGVKKENGEKVKKWE